MDNEGFKAIIPNLRDVVGGQFSEMIAAVEELANAANERGFETSARVLHAMHVDLLRKQLLLRLKASPQSANGRLLRLTYVSRMALPPSVNHYDLAEQISEISVDRNLSKSITGALCFGANWFAQILEGPTHAVLNLYDRIGKDPRHKDLHVIDWEQDNARLFGDWGMGFAGETPAEMIEKASQEASETRVAAIGFTPSRSARDLQFTLVRTLRA